MVDKEEKLGANLLNLLAATRNKRICTVSYQGKTRVFCPHLVGQALKKGDTEPKFVVHAYQFGGEGSKGPVTSASAGWRFFYLDDMDSVVQMSEGAWLPEELEKKEKSVPAFIVKVHAMAGEDNNG